MKKHLSTILFGLVFAAGLGLILYPSVSNWWNGMHQSRSVAEYSDAVLALPDEDLVLMRREAVEYNTEIRRDEARMHPTDESHERYMSLLSVAGDGIMGYIEIPSLGVSLPIYHTTDERYLQIGVGHIEGTSLPVGGSSTHAVLSGHRGLPSSKLFTDLDKMSVGDTFRISILGETLTYEVDQIVTVLPTETEETMRILPDRDLCTLVTCTPYGVNTHRLLVRGARVATETGLDVRIRAEADKANPSIVAIAIAAPAYAVMFIFVMASPSRRKKRR